MALNATQQWWVRAGGNELNGGGFDADVSGAGTNYADQDAAQLSLTDLACANNTTLTSATGGFTSQMVGNIIRIASGTNFTAGYYSVRGYTDGNTVTLDRNPTNGSNASGGTGRLGGAHASLLSYASGGTATQPAIASPLVNGNTINVRGGGTDTPSAADYTVSSGYWRFETGQYIRVVGYNGRPRFDVNGLMAHATTNWLWEHLLFVLTSNNLGNYGVLSSEGKAGNEAYDCRFNQAGYDVTAISGFYWVERCEFVNSGSTSAGTSPAVDGTFQKSNYGHAVARCKVRNWRGGAVTMSNGARIMRNIFAGCKATAYPAVLGDGNLRTDMPWVVEGNTFFDCEADGVYISDASQLVAGRIKNNIFVQMAGYGIKVAGSASTNDYGTLRLPDYNAFYSNTSGARSGISAGPNDITLTGDPFTDAASDDFSLNNTAGAGAACRAAALQVVV